MPRPAPDEPSGDGSDTAPATTGQDVAAGIGVAWLGHATTDIHLGHDGSTDRFVTDPVLRDRCGHLRRHRGTGTLDSPDTISALLISHLHHDHLDVPSLRSLPRGLPCVVPRGAGSLLRRTGLDVLEASVGDDLRVGDTVVTVVPAEHRPNRVASRRRADAVGYVLQRDGDVVYFPGDTDLHPVMSDLPRPDVALLPIWGWGRSLGPGHLDPHRAAQAAAILEARALLPIHWGTFAPVGVRRRPPRWFDEPARRLTAALAATSPTTRLESHLPGPDVVWF